MSISEEAPGTRETDAECHTCSTDKAEKTRRKDALFAALVTAQVIRVDDHGRTWRRHNGGWRRAESYSAPYWTTSIRIDGHQWLIPSHRLVWIARNGLIPQGLEVNHINNAGNDNRPSNLELLTHAENVRHALPYRMKAEERAAIARRELERLGIR